jgi:hypothetical protein
MNQSLGDKYIKDNFKMYLSVMGSCLDKPLWFKNFVYRRIYDINIWLVNNVLFRHSTLISDYEKSYNLTYPIIAVVVVVSFLLYYKKKKHFKEI